MSTAYFLRVAIPTPLRRLFDYLPPQDVDPKALKRGMRVKVPFQSRSLVGILVAVVTQSDVPYEKLKRATAILDKDSIFTTDIYQLCQWAADYYHYSLGEILASALPTLLRKGEADVIKKELTLSAVERDTLPQLNSAQQQAVDTIKAARATFKTFLLDGVTGSGKTEVYLRCIHEVLQSNQQVLVLVPEISLTPQTIDRFRKRFHAPVIALHSGLSDQERLTGWLMARNGGASIVIGTRSAIFTPFKSLGLIIVDEEHDPSFKQQDRFRYHARDLAVMRASLNNIPIVLGSATPSLESLLNVKRQRYEWIVLPMRAGLAQLPTYQIIDLERESLTEGVSQTLLDKMQVHLDQGNQVMLFLNRRGFAPVLYCTECAWIAECRRCDARMVYHRTPPRLQCHHCDSHHAIPLQCGKCHAASLAPIGLGTQRLEQLLKKKFAHVPIIRLDRDTTRRKNAMQDLLEQVEREPKAILLGTQMLAKGHHFPHVTLVGIVDADSGLFSADFRAAEQMGQLLLQVAGRAGRAEKPGTVVLQTRHPHHPLLQSLIQQGYQAFSQTLLAEREQADLPPYSYFAVLRAEAYDEERASQFLKKIKNKCESFDAINIFGPMPAIMAKRKGLYCQHLLIKANHRGKLQQFLSYFMQRIDDFTHKQPVKWVLDVDPVEVG